MIEPAMIADEVRGWPVMSANDVLIDDDTAETILEHLLKSWQPTTPIAAANVPAAPRPSAALPLEAHYSARLPAFRPALQQDNPFGRGLSATREATALLNAASTAEPQLSLLMPETRPVVRGGLGRDFRPSDPEAGARRR